MINNLLFDFKLDKAAKKVFITREFDANLHFISDLGCRIAIDRFAQ